MYKKLIEVFKKMWEEEGSVDGSDINNWVKEEICLESIVVLCVKV